MQRYVGHVPPTYLLIQQYGPWALYCKPYTSGNRWMTLKLINAKRCAKANFWLAWDGRRLAEGREFKTLREYSPEAADMVLGWLACGVYESWERGETVSESVLALLS